MLSYIFSNGIDKQEDIVHRHNESDLKAKGICHRFAWSIKILLFFNLKLDTFFTKFADNLT